MAPRLVSPISSGLLLGSLALGGCGADPRSTPPPTTASAPILVAAGDIASCGEGAEATARLLEPAGGCDAGSPQETWLRADLAAHPSPCALAYWHHPRFSSGTVHGDHDFVRDLWAVLQEQGVDIALAGHEHNYERFGPQDADGHTDPARGIREFVVGTGGHENLYPFGPPKANSQIRESGTWGVLELTLRSGSYDWRFITAAGGEFTDAGSEACR